MALGPVQFVAYGFENIDRFRGQILDELDRLESSGMIRVLDLLLLAKEENGDLVVLELDDDLTDQDSIDQVVEVGELLAMLFGFELEEADSATGDLRGSDVVGGLSRDDILILADELEPGTAAGILLVEHRWAVGFRDAVSAAGGVPLLQGYLSPDVMALIGAEALAVAGALESIEVAAAVEGEALLRSLEALAAAEGVESAVRSVIAADTLQILIDGGVLPASAALEAAQVLEDAGAIDRSLLG